MDSLQFQNSTGVYHVLITPVEQAWPEVKKFLDEEFGGYDCINPAWVYRYALNLMGEGERFYYLAQTCQLQLEDKLDRYMDYIRRYYKESVPSDLQLECFSALDMKQISPNLMLFRFTCDVPKEFAEIKYGVNFKYLDRCFSGSGAT